MRIQNRCACFRDQIFEDMTISWLARPRAPNWSRSPGVPLLAYRLIPPSRSFGGLGYYDLLGYVYTCSRLVGGFEEVKESCQKILRSRLGDLDKSGQTRIYVAFSPGQ